MTTKELAKKLEEAKTLQKIIEYTADNEMPECGNCTHFYDDYDCCRYCGAEHGWYGYKRFEKVD